MLESVERSTPVKTSKRINILRKKILRAPEICIERGYYWTESYKKTELEPEVVRRAKALENVLNNDHQYRRGRADCGQGYEQDARRPDSSGVSVEMVSGRNGNHIYQIL